MDEIRIDIRRLISFIEGQLAIFKVLPASDYRNGVIDGITITLKYLNTVGELRENIERDSYGTSDNQRAI